MTREEAIKALRYERKTALHENKSAFDMAIQALEQQKVKEIQGIMEGGWTVTFEVPEKEPSDDATLKDIFCMGCEYREQEPCDDAISREAVINVIYGMHVGGKEGIENALRNTYGADLREIIYEIDLLPSSRRSLLSVMMR